MNQLISFTIFILLLQIIHCRHIKKLCIKDDLKVPKYCPNFFCADGYECTIEDSLDGYPYCRELKDTTTPATTTTTDVMCVATPCTLPCHEMIPGENGDCPLCVPIENCETTTLSTTTVNDCPTPTCPFCHEVVVVPGENEGCPFCRFDENCPYLTTTTCPYVISCPPGSIHIQPGNGECPYCIYVSTTTESTTKSCPMITCVPGATYYDPGNGQCPTCIQVSTTTKRST